MSRTIGNCDVEGCEEPCCATHNHKVRHGTGNYGGCKCAKHVALGVNEWRRIQAERKGEQ
jgi:hypothetical protein